MTSILILDSENYRRENLARYLSVAGYEVSGFNKPGNLDSISLAAIDLVVLNLHPDAEHTWETYMWFKKKHPSLPVLVYMTRSFQAFRGLKQAISFVLNEDGNDCNDQNCDEDDTGLAPPLEQARRKPSG
jgi:DNA-binding NtrC family response regulator